MLTAEGLTDKTRVLDAKATGGPEIEAMRARWAELQNLALERQGHEVRVDHRSLAAQREAALAEGHEFKAEELDRAPEIKLGPAVSAIEWREMQAAWYEDRDYVPVTERGAAVQAVRQERAFLAELRARLELARDTWAHAREEGADRVTAGLAALRAAAQKHAIDREHGQKVVQEQAREHTLEAASLRERLARILDRGIGRKEAEVGPEHGQDDIRARLGRILGREVEQDHGKREGGGSEVERESRSIREKLQAVLAREKQVVGEKPGHEQEEQGEIRHRPRDRGLTHEL